MAIVDLEIVGRHAMLFDDDVALGFINSKEALIEWNSLFIDRFDVRNLIDSPPISFRQFTGSSNVLSDDDSHLYPDLDLERFGDLTSAASYDDIEFEAKVEAKDAGGYCCVPFSYGNSADSADQMDSNMDLNTSAFRPSFSVPDNLRQNLPPTEKVHQIIVRTAMFVGEHGGQSEFVLRVKQGDNPTFGFLIPHHRLHAYFRYLVDHPELLKSANDNKSQDEKPNDNQASGALYLLGSVYGSIEDEDVAAEIAREPELVDSGGTSSAADKPKSNQSEETRSSRNNVQKDDSVLVHPKHLEVNVTALSKHSINSTKPGASNMNKDGNPCSSTASIMEKPKALSLFPLLKEGTSFLDPPSEMKTSVNWIVEIVLKNGKDFEASLIEQDKNRGSFPFLLPSNHYNPYYLSALKKAQESRINGKTFCSKKPRSSGQGMDKNVSRQAIEDGVTPLDESDDLHLDSDKKEKFKMVIAKSKKDSQEQSKKSQQQCGFTVDVASTAAILQAATKGTRKPNLDIFSSASQPQSSTLKENGESNDTAPSSKDIAKLVARATASEIVSSEAGLIRQQKLKADRLRRAKMFAAMIKGGVAPFGTVPENVTEEVKGREGRCALLETWNLSSETAKSITDLPTDENEQKIILRRHYRSRKQDGGKGEEGDEGNREESEDSDEVDKKKRLRSRHSSRHHRDRSKDRHKRRRKHSSSENKESCHRHHKHDRSSLDNGNDEHHWHKHDSSSEEEHKHRKRTHRRDRSSEEDKHHHKRRLGRGSSHRHKQSVEKSMHRRRSKKDDRSVKEEADLEEGEIAGRSSDQPLADIGDDCCREISMNASKSPMQKKVSVPLPGATEVPDELRAKIRAMLLATM